MCKILKIRIIIHFFLFCLCGTVTSQNTITFKTTDFPEKQQLKGNKLPIVDELLNPFKVILIDSFMIVQNIETSPVFDIVNLNTRKIMARFCNRGRGPGELVSPFTFQYIAQSREIMVQDLQGKKLVFFSLEKILNNAPVKHTKTVTLDNTIMVRKLKMVQGGNFFCDLIGNKDGYMNALANNEGKLLRVLNKYPKTDFQFDPILGSNVFGVNIEVSSDMQTVIIPYGDTDMIDIYNAEGKQQLKMIGPNFKKLHVAQGLNGATLTNKNNLAFRTPYASNNSFIVPYIGRPYRLSDPHGHTNQLFWIGLNGDLLKHFEVSPPVSQIAVDWEKRIIYGLNVEMEPAVYMYKY
jgi:hypothetical protein